MGLCVSYSSPKLWQEMGLYEACCLLPVRLSWLSVVYLEASKWLLLHLECSCAACSWATDTSLVRTAVVLLRYVVYVACIWMVQAFRASTRPVGRLTGRKRLRSLFAHSRFGMWVDKAMYRSSYLT